MRFHLLTLALLLPALARAFDLAALPPPPATPSVALPADFDAFAPPAAVATPSPSAPAIAEFTRSGGPVDAIVLSGLRFSTHSEGSAAFGRDTRFVVWTRADDGSVVQADADILALREDLATISLPPGLPAWRTYLLWPVNAAGAGSPVLLNRTELWWLGPEAAARGELIGLHGRNLSHGNGTGASWIWIQRPDGSAGRWLAPARVNPHRVEFTVPADLPDGTWRVFVHNGHGGAWGWSEPQTLVVDSFGVWTGPELDATAYGVVPDDGLSDSDALATALTALRNAPAGSTLRLPAGALHLSRPLPDFRERRVVGAGMDSTRLLALAGYGAAGHTTLTAAALSRCELADLTLDSNGENIGGVTLTERVRLARVRVSNAAAIEGQSTLGAAPGNNASFVGCEFICGGGGIWLGSSTQMLFKDCSFLGAGDVNQLVLLWGGGRVAFVDCRARDLDNTRADGWAQGRFFVAQSHIGPIDGVYIGGLVTTDLGVRPGFGNQNTGEQILLEGGLDDWRGSPADVGADYIVMPGSFDFVGLATRQLAITEGPGRGQSRRLVGWDPATRRLQVDRPFLVPPAAESVIQIGRYFARTAIYGCTLDGKAEAVTSTSHTASAGVEPYGAALDLVVAANRFTDIRTAIAVFRPFDQEIGGAVVGGPTLFQLYEGNTIDNSRIGFLLTAGEGQWNDARQITVPATPTESLIGTVLRRTVMRGVVENSVRVESQIPGFADDKHAFAMTVIDGLSVRDTAGPVNFPAGRTGEQVLRDLDLTASPAGAGAPALSVAGAPRLSLRDVDTTGFASRFSGAGLPGARIEPARRVFDLEPAAGGGWSARVPLVNLGGSDGAWSALCDAAWLRLSAAAGDLPAAGGAAELIVGAAEIPRGATTAQITISGDGGSSQVTIRPPASLEPALPPVPLVTGDDSATPVLSGVTYPGFTVRARIDGTLDREATVDATGAWTLALSGLGDGAHLVSVRWVNSADEAGPWTSPVVFTSRGGAAPAAPAIVNDASVDVAATGLAPAGTRLIARVDGTVFGECVADAGGRWRLSLAGTETGLHQLTVSVRIGTTEGPPSAATPFSTRAAAGLGTGLTGVYHDDATFSVPAYTRVDSLIAFDWWRVRPAAPVTLPTMSVRWTGALEAPLSGRYRFSVFTGGPTEIWIDGTRVAGGAPSPRYNDSYEGEVTLVAGRRHDVVIGYANTGGDTRLLLRWRGPGGMATNYVPTDRLYPEPPVAGLTPPPAPPAPSVSDQGTSAPTLSGTAAPGSTVSIFLGGNRLTTVAAGPDGAWTCPLPATLPSGSHAARVSAHNAAGSSAMSAPAAVRVDRVQTPGFPVYLDQGLPDPILAGTVSPGALVAVHRYAGWADNQSFGPLIGYARADGNGRWTFALRGIPAGHWAFIIRTTTPAGTSWFTHAYNDLTFPAGDFARPAAPALPALLDDNTSRTRFVGQATPGGRLMIVIDDVQHALLTVGDDGNWSWDAAAALPAGQYQLKLFVITGTEATGGTFAGADSAPLAFSVGASAPTPRAPAAPVIRRLAPGDDGRVLVSGDAEAFAMVELRVGSLVVGRAWADAEGRWAVRVSCPTTGVHSLTARAANNIGVGPAGAATSIIIATPSALDGYGRWLGEHGLSMDGSGSGARLADPDADGAPNLLEYALGGSPSADDSSRSPALSRDPATGRLSLAFTRARAELTYTVEASNDLSSWQPLATNPGAVGQLVTVADTLPATPGDAPPPRRFLRLRVESP